MYGVISICETTNTQFIILSRKNRKKKNNRYYNKMYSLKLILSVSIRVSCVYTVFGRLSRHMVCVHAAFDSDGFLTVEYILRSRLRRWSCKLSAGERRRTARYLLIIWRAWNREHGNRGRRRCEFVYFRWVR